MYIRLANEDQHVELARLLHRYPSHEHGWEARVARHVFDQKESRTDFQSTSCLHCAAFTQAVKKRARNWNDKACLRLSRYLEPGGHQETATAKQSTITAQLTRTTQSARECTIPANKASECNECGQASTNRHKPLIRKPDKPLCEHWFSDTCFMHMAVHQPAPQYKWNRHPMINID